MYFDLSENQLVRVRPDQLQRYLEVLGWTRVDEIPGRCSIYHLLPSNEAEIVVPLDVQFRDYTRRIAEVVRELGELTDRSPDAVLRDILMPLMDVVSYRVEGPSTRDHQIGLLIGVDLYQSALGTFKAAAHDQISPKRFHPRMTRKEAFQYLEACQLGVPVAGSFVINMYCPADLAVLDSQNPTGTLFPEEALDRNYARRVTARAVQSMSKAVQAISNDQIDTLIPLEDTADTISSNFFDALGDIQVPDVVGKIVVTVEWTPALAAPAGVPTEIVLQREYPAIFKDIALRLRPSTAPKTEQIRGRVATLSGEPGETNLMEGEVIIYGSTSEKETVRVRVDLSDRDYIVACDAHKLNQNVHIAGTLIRGPRLHTLSPYMAFHVIQ